MISLREAFGDTLVYLAPKYDFVVFDCDVAGGTGTYKFRDKYPKRFYQFGIAEQNAMGAAAGFASQGVPVFFTTMASFALRAWEIARVSVCYANRPVYIVGSHVGMECGPDGATAQCVEDFACWRSIPQMRVYSPMCAWDLYQTVEHMLEEGRPAYMRSGRNPQPEMTSHFQKGWAPAMSIVDYGDDADLNVIATGVMVYRALVAFATGKIKANIISVNRIKPLGMWAGIYEMLAKGKPIVVAEDHNRHGGLGDELRARILTSVPVGHVAIQDRWGTSDEPEVLAKEFGLEPMDIYCEAQRLLEGR